MNTYTIIEGRDLIKVVEEPLKSQLDPDGNNVVEFSMIHNDNEIRAIVLCKIKGQEGPVEATLTIPLGAYMKIGRKLYFDGETQH